MPSSLIEVRRQYSRSDEVALIDAVHDALVAAFRIPVGDKHVRLVAHEPHRVSHAPHLAHPERYTLVTIDCFAGRSVAAKRELYREIVGRLAAFDQDGLDLQEGLSDQDGQGAAPILILCVW